MPGPRPGAPLRYRPVVLRWVGVVLLLGLGGGAGAAPPTEAGAGGIEIAYLNQTYTDLAGEIAPIGEGPLTIRLASPAHRVTLHRNRLVLVPNAGGDPEAWVEAEFEGRGDLVAHVEGGPMATRFEDRVAAPRQTLRLRGKARVARDPQGYTVFLVAAPPSAPVEIRSGVVADIVGVCESLAILGALDCGRLERALSRVNVPLRPERTAVRLPRERLSAAEIAYLDRFAAP